MKEQKDVWICCSKRSDAEESSVAILLDTKDQNSYEEL